jgi:flagellar motor protein MotB
LSLADGKFIWEDQAVDKITTTTIFPVTLALENFSTTGHNPFELQLNLALEQGGSFRWEGDVGIYPLFSKGRIKINDIKLQSIFSPGVVSIPFKLTGIEYFDSDYQASYIDNNFKFSSSNSKIKLIDVEYADNKEGSVQIKIPQLNHVADLNVEYGNNTVLIKVNKSDMNIRNFQFMGLMPDKRMVGFAEFSHSVEFSAKNHNKIWQVAINKSSINIKDLKYTAESDNTAITIPFFNYTADVNINNDKNNWKVSANNSTIDIRNFQFLGLDAGKSSINIPSITHSADITFNGNNNNWSISSTKSNIDIKNFQFLTLEPNKSSITIPAITHTADLNINSADNVMQLGSKQSLITVKDARLADSKSAQSINIPNAVHTADINIKNTDNNWSITSNKSKIDINNIKYSKTDSKSTVNVPAISQTADINMSNADGKWKISSNQTKIEIKNVQYVKGASGQAMQVPAASYIADLKIDNSDNIWQVISNKSKIDVRDFQFSSTTREKLLIKMPGFSHVIDFKLKLFKNGLELASKNSKVDIKNFQFSGLIPETTTINIPEFSHGSDFIIKNVDKSWLVDARKSIIDIKNGKLSQTDLDISGLNTRHDTDYRLNLTDNSYQISVSNGNLAINNTKVRKDKLLVDIPLVTLHAALESSHVDNILKLVVQQGNFDSKDVSISEPGDTKPLVKIASTALRNIGFDLANRKLQLDSVFAEGAEVRTWLNKEGVINYQTLFADTKKDSIVTRINANSGTKITYGNTPQKKTRETYSVMVNTMSLTNFGLDFEDRSLKKPVNMTLKSSNFSLKNFNSQAGQKFPFQFDTNFNNSGLIKLNGDASLEPFNTDMTVDINDINLARFQPYLEKFVRLNLVSGQLNADGKLAVSEQKNSTDIKYTGNTKIANFVTRDLRQHRDLIKWQSLTLKNMAVDALKNTYTASALIIEKPYARVIINKNKTVNFAEIVIADKNVDKKTESSKSEVPKSKANANAKKPLFYKLDKIQFVNGSSDFSDNSLIMPFSAQIESLDGGASDISSDKKSNVKVSLKGSAYNLSPVEIDGNIKPYQGDYDIKVNFKGLPMPLISPYMVQFAGYKIEKGKMNLGLRYKVENKVLTASNNIFISQFELGEKVENPNAVSLPLELAVSLLKDSSGNIKIDIPITGSLENPQFSIGAVITDALMSALSKVITSPFNAIASLVGSSEDLSTIGFKPGSFELDKDEKAKLDELAKALKKRPNITLEIKGTAFSKQDWPAIRESALYDRIKRMRADELNEASDQKILPEYVDLSDKDYKRLLAQRFIQKFPALAKKSLFGTPELVNPKMGDFYVVAKQKLMDAMTQDEARLKALASKRAQTIARYLVEQQKIPNDQVYILDTVVDPKTKTSGIESLLSLRGN